MEVNIIVLIIAIVVTVITGSYLNTKDVEKAKEEKQRQILSNPLVNIGYLKAKELQKIIREQDYYCEIQYVEGELNFSFSTNIAGLEKFTYFFMKDKIYLPNNLTNKWKRKGFDFIVNSLDYDNK